jgi:CheY-like chemotaxis protein
MQATTAWGNIEDVMTNEIAPIKTALVVDDGPVERLTGKTMLEKLGFSTRTAASGEEALALLEQQPVRLVLCDVSMPGMSGMALMKAVQSHPHPPLFIMVTSHDDAVHAQAAFDQGAYAYLIKPLRLDTLCDIVDDISI